MATAKNMNDKMVERIDAVKDKLDEDDRGPLLYIRGQLTPEGIQARQEWDPDVKHLHDTAKQRLKAYENKTEAVA